MAGRALAGPLRPDRGSLPVSGSGEGDGLRHGDGGQHATKPASPHTKAAGLLWRPCNTKETAQSAFIASTEIIT